MKDRIEPPSRSTVRASEAWVIGANRGAKGSQAALEEHAGHLALTYVDPVGERAARLAELGKKKGLKTRAVEMRVEELLASGSQRPQIAILQVDRASAICALLEDADIRSYAVIGLLLVDAPRIGLVALRFAAGAQDHEARARMRALFAGIAAVSSRDGSQEIFDAGAPPERVGTESRMRASFGAYLGQHLDKLAAGLDATGAPVEASFDGTDARPVAVLDADVLEEEPYRVAERVVAERQIVPRRGRAFLCVEIGRHPEPAVRMRSGVVRRDQLLQVGRPRDLVLAEADEQARTRLAISRAESPTADRLDMGAVLGLALATSLAGVATRTFPLTTTD